MSQPPRPLAWDDFRLIKAVAEARNLAGAAARLDVNHSTVFRRLGQLEATLGTRLFERHRTGYVPTAAGEAMLALAERMDEDIAAFARKLAGQEPSPAGELRVTTSDTLLLHLLTPILARFRAHCPLVRLDLVIGNLALNLSRRDADVAIRASDRPPETLVGRRVARLAWAVYGAAADFPQPGHAGPEQLAGRFWVAPSDSLGATSVSRFVAAQAPPERIAYRVNSVLGLAEAIEAGIGVGPLPCFIADARPGLRRLAPPEPSFAADLWLLTHPDLRHAARVRVFLDFVAGEIAHLRAFIEGETVTGGETAIRGETAP